MANMLVTELEAQEYVFLTLGAGLTLQKGERVIFKSDLANRMVEEARGKLTVSNDFKFDFLDADVGVDPANTITETAHGMLDGDPVRLESTGVLPAGLELGLDYYVVNKTDDTFQLSLSVGGAVVQITSAAGGGTHSVNKMRSRLKFSNFELV